MHKRSFLAAALAAAGSVLQPAAWAEGASPVEAPSLHLLLQYDSTSIGHDGVQRESRHADRMFRARQQVWIEREMPQVVRQERAHGHKPVPGPHAGHAHDEAQGAPLFVSRDAQGQVLVQVVLQAQRRLIEVDRAHHGNVGYGGSWEAAYWLIDPEALQRMEPLPAQREGVRRYRLRQGERTTEVDWDVAGQYARRVETRDAHGLSRQRMTASVHKLPEHMPWDAVARYARGDYSDLLD